MEATQKLSPLVPRSSKVIVAMLIFCCMVQSATLGYDGSMMNGLNILPSYTDYFQLTTVTTALNTSVVNVGSALAGFVNGLLCDRLGRRMALYWAALITIVGIILQSAAQNIGMFIVGRLVIGFGVGISSAAAPTYLAEAVPYKWRALTLGLFYVFWYVGALLAAGITYGTTKIDSTWAWRTPSILQGVFSLVCIAILPFLPESPRWLIYRGRQQEGKVVLAATHSDGHLDDPAVLLQYKEIVDTIEFEKANGQSLTMRELISSPSNRRRISLSTSVAVFSMLSGNNIISYYLGSMLDNAGVTDATTQLQINVILNGFCLVPSIAGSLLANKLGRRFLAISSTASLTVFIFIIGALTAVYGDSDNVSGIYATVASIFLFQGCCSFGWTPLSVMYPPEVLSYSMRANGMGIYCFTTSGVGLLVTFAFPIALDVIGWKIYMINGAWDVLELLYVVFYWVETKGRTLEEIDEIFDGVKHSDAPDIKVLEQAQLKGGDEIIIGQVISNDETRRESAQKK